MKCDVCGRQTQNEEANFCEYCGSSFREHIRNAYQMPPQNQGLPYSAPPMNNMAPASGYGMPGGIPGGLNGEQKERSTTFLSWLGTYALLLIPVVGWIVFIALLFVWAFSSETSATKKSWARATLIFAAVLVVIIIGYLILLISSPMYQEMYQGMKDGTFDYNTYYQNLLDSYQ